jgi:UrcA family protein
MRNPIALIGRGRTMVAVMLALGAVTFGCVAAQATDLQEVTVTVPTVKTIGRDASGAPIQQVTATARVQYDPVMLQTRAGRLLLRNKVADVARRLCREVDTLGVTPTEDEGACVQRAVNGARVQIAAAAAEMRAG